MKFLCVPCDEQMRLSETLGPDEGSVSLVYSCDQCGYEFAMLTNPHETQVVGSLGVKLGAGEPAGQAAESKCPFTGMVQQMSGEKVSEPDEVPWTAEAAERLEGIPAFIRPMAKTGIERFAKENGHHEIDTKVLEAARSHFGV